MATSTQYNPNQDLNRALLAAGASKTVYALVTPETELCKAAVFDSGTYYEGFREAWTGKQDATHVEFFDKWCEWSKPVVDLDRNLFPFFYPTAGASEPLRHLIYDYAARVSRWTMWPEIHVFRGEYEGYKAMGEAAGVKVIEHDRKDWRDVRDKMAPSSLFLISQPSAIDGMVWHDFNEFVGQMADNSVIADITYVGAVPERSLLGKRFNLNAKSVRNIVFSLSKPFGLYYDRVGGVFSRTEDLGLFGNRWFKNLTGLRIGTLMLNYGVFDFPDRHRDLQMTAINEIGAELGLGIHACDVFILGHAKTPDTDLGRYLDRAGRVRICLTPYMAEMIGTTGKRRP